MMTDREQLPQNLYCAEGVRELDRRAMETGGIAGETLMERAGRAAWHVLRERWPGARRITVLCGKGNNGGDGFVIARLAREEGLKVHLLCMGDVSELRGSAAWAAQEYLAGGGDCRRFEEGVTDPLRGGPEVVVDALLGTGLQREVGGGYRGLIEAVNASGVPVMAVDVPSGLDADTGAVLGVAVRASVTPTFIGLKQGLLTGDGPDCAGAVRFDDLGVPAATYEGVPVASRRVTDADRRSLLPARARSAHKGHFGHVLLLGGGPGMAGAIRMAGEAAQRSGAGLVTVATTPDHAAVVNVQRPELMAAAVDAPEDLDAPLSRATVIGLGPGLGVSDWSRRLWRAALGADRPMVLDADALNLLAEQPRRGHGWILTPHPGEAARLLESSTAAIQRDRFSAAAELVERYGGVVILKGAGTVVTDGQETALVDAGNPGMASGGMGDVLTGVVAGFLAQGLAAFDAARLGAYVHARAADAAAAEGGERGLLATDLLSGLRVLVNPVPD